VFKARKGTGWGPKTSLTPQCLLIEFSVLWSGNRKIELLTSRPTSLLVARIQSGRRYVILSMSPRALVDQDQAPLLTSPAHLTIQVTITTCPENQ
jgi:hypothetical protein